MRIQRIGAVDDYLVDYMFILPQSYYWMLHWRFISLQRKWPLVTGIHKRGAFPFIIEILGISELIINERKRVYIRD